MKKKTFQQPQIQIIEVNAADIICTSTEGLTQDNFMWGDLSGSSTEGLGEDIFGW